MNRIGAALSLLVLAASCSRSQGDAGADGLTQPARLCRAGAPIGPCRSPDDIEDWLASADLEILDARRTPSGVQGARLLRLRDGVSGAVFRAKWRAHSTATSRNSPRRELAAYAVQTLFLEPQEYVVPPTAPHCFPLEAYRAAVDRKARATFGRTTCVYGVLSYWLEDVASLAEARSEGWFRGQDGHALDRGLFAENAGYRDSIATVNLFTHVIAHADSHARNFVVTRERAHPFVYSVDNSLSLGLAKNPKLPGRSDWSRLRVPSLPRGRVDRLRELAGSVDRLREVAELERRGGALVVVEPSIERPPSDGMDWVGDRLRIGLTASEIDGVRDRVARLLARVERGQLRLH